MEKKSCERYITNDSGVWGTHHTVLFFSVLLLLVCTAFPSVPGGDAGELLAEACQAGVPHPPGYPLWTLLNHALARAVAVDALPLSAPKPPGECLVSIQGRVAWASNLLCCILGASTAVLACLTVEDWTRGFKDAYNPTAAMGGALLFALSPLAWEYSTGTEVFALNNFLVAAIIYLTSRTIRRPTVGTARVGALVCGFALSNQHASVLVAAPMALAVLIALCRVRGKLTSCWVMLELGGLWLPAGLSPYTFLLYAAHRPRQGSWGDLTTARGFIRHILREEYGTLQLGPGGNDSRGLGGEGAVQRVLSYLMNASQETLFMGPPLAALGIAWALMVTRSEHQSPCIDDVDDHSTVKSQCGAKEVSEEKKKREGRGVMKRRGKGKVQEARQDLTEQVSLSSVFQTSPPPAPSSAASSPLHLTGTNSNSTAYSFGLALLSAWSFYVIFWHCVLSNLSLQHPMSRAVHSRFWMQPNLLLCEAAGAGLGVLANFVRKKYISFVLLPQQQDTVSAAFAPGKTKAERVPTMRYLLLSVAVGWAMLSRTGGKGVTEMGREVWRVWGDVGVNRCTGDDCDEGILGRSAGGWTMHLYAQAILSSLPSGALLLSHTDLDLNPVRYLRVCEGARSDVTHISLQMMPYPWWERVQVALHPGVKFPPILPRVSTRRESMGNTLLVTRFLRANRNWDESWMDSGGKVGMEGVVPGVKEKRKREEDKGDKFGKGGRPMFLDMQAVDEREVEAAGSYHGLTLLPWGLTYRVLPGMSSVETETWHSASLDQLTRLQRCLQPAPRDLFPPGTWEFAASSVFWDAHYQMGLFFLSYALDVWKPGVLLSGQRAAVLGALQTAASLLGDTLEAVDAYDTFSSPRADLLKNTMLAYVRLQNALELGLVEEEVTLAQSSRLGTGTRASESSRGTEQIGKRDGSGRVRPVPLTTSIQASLSPQLEEEVVQMPFPAVTRQVEQVVRMETLHHLERFLKEHPRDRDANAFARVYSRLREVSVASGDVGEGDSFGY